MRKFLDFLVKHVILSKTFHLESSGNVSMSKMCNMKKNICFMVKFHSEKKYMYMQYRYDYDDPARGLIFQQHI